MDRERSDGRQPDLRASDADRDRAIAQLRRHHVDGRLDWEEFSERLDRASRARTREELRGLLSDLPPLVEPDAASGPAQRQPAGPWSTGPWSGRWWRPWLAPPVIALLILGAVLFGAWAFGGGPGPYRHGFFPLFPLLLWGLLLARLILPRRGWRRW
ncbi:MAG TPA: DUF1707 domain-containing protein [Actinomycetes bacterium]|jgi:hypothetical protein|nr:DUF1707 domain-containing protein [Actinomycetes bacterium]